MDAKQQAVTLPDAPLNEPERSELARLRGEVGDKDAKLSMQVEFAKEMIWTRNFASKTAATLHAAGGGGVSRGALPGRSRTHTNTPHTFTSVNAPSNLANKFDLTSWLTKDVVSLIAVLALLMYGISRPAYDSFYAQLGMTPEDVGLNQGLILFRTAMNVSREWTAAAFIGTFTYLCFLLSKKFFKFVKPTSKIIPYICAALVMTGAVILMLRLLNPGDRLGATWGLGGSVLLVGIPIFLVYPGKRATARRVIAVVTLAAIGLFFGLYTDGAENAGKDFLNTGRVNGPFGFILNIRYNDVRPVLIENDVARICVTPAHFQYLGGTGDYSYVLVRPAGPPTVVRFLKDDYRLLFGQNDSIVSCLARNKPR